MPWHEDAWPVAAMAHGRPTTRLGQEESQQGSELGCPVNWLTGYPASNWLGALLTVTVG